MTAAELYRIHCLFNGLQLEINGERSSALPSCYSTIKETYHLSGTREEVSKQFIDWVASQPIKPEIKALFTRRKK